MSPKRILTLGHATHLKTIVRKGKHTNLMKHLVTQGKQLKAQRYTMFDCLRDPMFSSTSNGSVGVLGPGDGKTTVDTNPGHV